MLSFTPSATAAPPLALQLVFMCFCFIGHVLMYPLAGRHQHDVAANHSHKFVLSHSKHQSPRSNRPHHTIVHGSSQLLQACTPHSAHVGPAHHCHVPCRQGCDSIGAPTLPLLHELFVPSNFVQVHAITFFILARRWRKSSNLRWRTFPKPQTIPIPPTTRKLPTLHCGFLRFFFNWRLPEC